MRKILITGSNGQLGIELNKQYNGDSNISLINTDVDDLDITKIDDVMSFVKDIKPNIIINCAAYTAVDACENDEDRAFAINAIGPRNLSIASNEIGARLMHISTDYVFDGNKESAYYEWDQENPKSAYGRTKLMGERFVRDYSNRYYILRTAWLYGEGKNFVKTMLNLASTRDVVGVVSDQYGTPTSALELGKAIIGLVNSDNYGLFHATCEGACSWADFAQKIFEIAGTGTKVDRITTEEYPTPAKRPANSVLENYMLKSTGGYRLANWEDAIKEYMRNIHNVKE